MAQPIQGHSAGQGQIFHRVIVVCSTGTLAKLYVQGPVLLIFDTSMTAHRGSKLIWFRERAEKITIFCAGWANRVLLIGRQPANLTARAGRSTVFRIHTSA